MIAGGFGSVSLVQGKCFVDEIFIELGGDTNADAGTKYY
jgi:hypothetical protein